jgi:hypothetical protein
LCTRPGRPAVPGETAGSARRLQPLDERGEGLPVPALARELVALIELVIEHEGRAKIGTGIGTELTERGRPLTAALRATRDASVKQLLRDAA